MNSPIPKFVKKHLAKLSFIPPVAIGVVILILLVVNQNRPQREPELEVARVVRVIHAPLQEIVPRAIGYGTAEPANIWQAIAEVKGKVIEVHEDLSAGSIIKKDAVLLRIDPAEYELAVARLEAGIRQAEAQLDELIANKANDDASLAIEKDSLALAESDLRRLRGLLEGDAASTSAVEQSERSLLSQRQKLQSLTNSLNLFPSKKKSLEANIAVQQAQLEQAKLDLMKTLVVAPFDCRLGIVAIEVQQFLSAGQILFEAHNVDSIEVEAQVTLQDIQKLIQLTSESQSLNLDMETMRQVFRIDAVVRFQQGDRRIEWPARFARVRENLDSQTRTLGVVFSIDAPYRQAIPGKRPPALGGMFCEVEIRSQKRVEQVIIPRTALHQGFVYLADENNRLSRREVQVSFAQSGFVAIEEGLNDNDVVVVSDPTPAVIGMLLELKHDDDLRQRIVNDASAIGDVK